MSSLISHLSKTEQQKLLDDLNYLNLKEMRQVCKEFSIPYAIWIETENGERKRTTDTDRKSVVLDRIRKYLKTGKAQNATTFSAKVVCLDAPPRKLQATDRLYYGWYDKKNEDMMGLLRRLTNGEFKNGAVARILAREFWTAGKAPTFAEYAKAWVKANKKGLGIEDSLHPEAAWLTDRARNQAGKNWKTKREAKAKRVLRVLATISRKAK